MEHTSIIVLHAALRKNLTAAYAVEALFVIRHFFVALLASFVEL